MAADQDRQIADVVRREGSRLLGFIRARVPDPAAAEDILQDAFFELVLAYRLTRRIEDASAWLFRVARNRITDWFRLRKPEISTAAPARSDDEDEAPLLGDLLPSGDAGPEAAYARAVLVEELEDALAELPREQRDAFIAHEIDGKSFRELSEETGVGINTLLARKHYAVRHLRERLRTIYDDLKRD